MKLSWFAPRRWFNFTGRASRRELIGYYLLVVLILLPMFLLFDRYPSQPESPLFLIVGSVSNVLLLVWCIMVLAVQVRRLHDHEQSGWMLLWGFLPLVGWMISVILLFTPGDEDENHYGPDPRYSEQQVNANELEQIF